MLSLRELLSTQYAWEHLCGRQLFGHLGALISPHEQQLSSSSSASTTMQSSLSSSASASSEGNKVSTSALGTFYFHLLMVAFLFFSSVWRLCAVWAGIGDVFLFITILSRVETFSSDEAFYHENSSLHDATTCLRFSPLCRNLAHVVALGCFYDRSGRDTNILVFKSSVFSDGCISLCLYLHHLPKHLAPPWLLWWCWFSDAVAVRLFSDLQKLQPKSRQSSSAHECDFFFLVLCGGNAAFMVWVMCHLFWCCWNT